MQKTVLVFLGLTLALFVWLGLANFQSRQHAVEPLRPTTVQAEMSETRPLDVEPVAIPEPSLRSDVTDQPEFVEGQALSEDEGIADLLEKTNLMNSASIHQTVEQLRISDANKVGEYFQASLKEIKQLDQRDRLLQIGNAWQAEELLGFWRDIALRQTPRYEDEIKLKNAIEPTISQNAINLELILSIRNLGLIAFKREEALDALQQIVMKPLPQIHDAVIREQAFLAIREVDSVKAIRIFKGLAKEDGLRTRIIAAQKALNK